MKGFIGYLLLKYGDDRPNGCRDMARSRWVYRRGSRHGVVVEGCWSLVLSWQKCGGKGQKCGGKGVCKWGMQNIFRPGYSTQAGTKIGGKRTWVPHMSTQNGVGYSKVSASRDSLNPAACPGRVGWWQAIHQNLSHSWLMGHLGTTWYVPLVRPCSTIHSWTSCSS